MQVSNWPSFFCGTRKFKSQPSICARARRTLKCLTEIFPHLRGWGEAPCKTFSVDAVAGSGAGTVFLATPHEASLEIVPQLLNAGLRVVDLSGAFRFHDPQTFADWYKLPAPPKNLAERAVYGLPELYADQLPDARLVANPGCYPTSVILGLRPLVESGWIATERGIVPIASPARRARARTEERTALR